MTTNDYLPDRRVLAGFVIIGLILASGMLLMLEPRALATLLGKAGEKSTTVYVVMPNNVGSTPTLNFEPARILVRVGLNNTVVWTDNDIESGQSHTVTTISAPAQSANFDSLSSLGAMDPGDSFSMTLTIVGSYHYHCRFHPWMTGQIDVASSPSA